MANNKTQKIMVILKKKKNHIDQIYKYTLDMEKSASQNDNDTINLLLDMRYSLMTEVEEFDEQVKIIVDSLSPVDRIRINAQMSESHISSETSFEEDTINELYLSIKALLRKIIESDRKLNIKIKALSKLSAIESV